MRLRPGDVKNGPDDAGADELEKALHAEMGDESPPKIRGEFFADFGQQVHDAAADADVARRLNVKIEWGTTGAPVRAEMTPHTVDLAPRSCPNFVVEGNGRKPARVAQVEPRDADGPAGDQRSAALRETIGAPQRCRILVDDGAGAVPHVRREDGKLPSQGDADDDLFSDAPAAGVGMRRDLDGDAAKKQASAGPAHDEMKKKKEGDNARLMPFGNDTQGAQVDGGPSSDFVAGLLDARKRWRIAQENSAVLLHKNKRVRSNLGGGEVSSIGRSAASTAGGGAHWFRSCAAICCCSASGTEQVPSSLRTTWPRWMSPHSWS